MLVEHDGGAAAVEGSHAMPGSYPFTADLRVLCERGVLEHRFVAGAGDEVDAAVTSVLGVHPADGDAATFSEAGDPWGAQIAHFLDCVSGGSEPRDGSFAQARAALAVALAARAAAESGSAAERGIEGGVIGRVAGAKPRRVSSCLTWRGEKRNSTLSVDLPAHTAGTLDLTRWRFFARRGQPFHRPTQPQFSRSVPELPPKRASANHVRAKPARSRGETRVGGHDADRPRGRRPQTSAGRSRRPRRPAHAAARSPPRTRRRDRPTRPGRHPARRRPPPRRGRTPAARRSTARQRLHGRATTHPAASR